MTSVLKGVSNYVRKKQKHTKKVSKKTPSVSPVPLPTEGVVPSTPPMTPIEGDVNSQKMPVDKDQQELMLISKLFYANLKNTIINEKKREINALDQVLREFVGPYMLIGYDINNNPIEMVSATSPAEHDALLERLRRVMYKINQNIANSNGADPYGQAN